MATGTPTVTRPATQEKPQQSELGELRQKGGDTITTPTTKPVVGKTLAAKLANAAREIDRVAKRGHNKTQNYDFATAGDIFDEIRAKLAGQRVALHWTIDRENTKFDEVTSSGGSKGLLCTLWVTYSFIDGDDGSRLDYYTCGTSNDFPGDKAIYKAQTNALKYLLMQTFLVSTGDDVEKDDQPGNGQSATYASRQQHTRSASTGQASNGHADTPMTDAQRKFIERQNSQLQEPKSGYPWETLLKQPYDRALAAMSVEHERQCGRENKECLDNHLSLGAPNRA